MIRRAKKGDIKGLYEIIHRCIKTLKIEKRVSNNLKKRYIINNLKKFLKNSEFFVFEKKWNCSRMWKT